MKIVENLVDNLFDESKLEKAPTRNGFGKGLVEAAEKNENVVGLCADLTESTRMHWFAEKFPERFIQTGVAEQNLAGVAAGMALVGKVPFAASYATFSPGRNWDQIRVSICYSETNVKIVGAHAGLTVGPDGATHQALEDVAITRVLPKMTVVVPADSEQAKKATLAISDLNGPAYIRLGRSDVATFTKPDTDFVIGKAQKLLDGDNLTIIACGSMVYKSIQAAYELEKEGISIDLLNLHTIKPIDSEAILKSVRKTNKLITIEEHQISGGMGSAVAEVVSEHHPVKTKMIGVNDTFGESGTPDELFEKYGLTVDRIVEGARKIA